MYLGVEGLLESDSSVVLILVTFHTHRAAPCLGRHLQGHLQPKQIQEEKDRNHINLNS